jgi:hypothetical protein
MNTDFHDEFMDKQSEIISLFKEVINDETETIYVFLYNDDSHYMFSCSFDVSGKNVVGNLEAGVSDEAIDEISNIILMEILPEMEEICNNHNQAVPVEFRFIYNNKTGAFDANYRYEYEINKTKPPEEE